MRSPCRSTRGRAQRPMQPLGTCVCRAHTRDFPTIYTAGAGRGHRGRGGWRGRSQTALQRRADVTTCTWRARCACFQGIDSPPTARSPRTPQERVSACGWTVASASTGSYPAPPPLIDRRITFERRLARDRAVGLPSGRQRGHRVHAEDATAARVAVLDPDSSSARASVGPRRELATMFPSAGARPTSRDAREREIRTDRGPRQRPHLEDGAISHESCRLAARGRASPTPSCCAFFEHAHLARRSLCHTAMSRDVGLLAQWLLFAGQGSIKVSWNTGFGVALCTAVLLTTPSPLLFFRLAFT